MNTGFQFTNRHWGIVTDMGSVGTNYYTDMGFVARIDNYDALKDTVVRMGFKQLYNEITYRLFPEKGKVVQHVMKFTTFVVLNPDYTVYL